MNAYRRMQIQGQVAGNQSSTRPTSCIVTSVVLPSRLELRTLSWDPGAKRFSFSFPKKVIAEMSACIFPFTVRSVHFPPQPFMKFLATCMSAVQLLTPHHVTVDPFGYWSNKST